MSSIFSHISSHISSHIFSHVPSPISPLTSSHLLLILLPSTFHPLLILASLYLQSLPFLKQDLLFSFLLQTTSHPHLHTISTEQARAGGGRRGLNPDERMEVAPRDGLSKDRSGIDSNPVYRKLKKETSQPQYDTMWDFWEACVLNITKSRIASTDTS